MIECVWGGYAWGGIVRYLMENKAAGKNLSGHGIFSQVVISGFTGFLAGVYCYEQGYSELKTMVFSGLGGAFGGRLLDFLWRRFADSLKKIALTASSSNKRHAIFCFQDVILDGNQKD